MAGKTLVTVFSASGVTKKVGKEIARIADADFFEIVPKEIYTSDDLNWMNKQSRSSVEMNDPSARPEIAGNVSDMASCQGNFSRGRCNKALSYRRCSKGCRYKTSG